MEIAVGQTVVLHGVENAGIDLTGKRGTVTAELPGGLVSVALAGGADVISVWPEHLKVVPSEPSDYFRAATTASLPHRFYIEITRTTEVVGVDWNMFEDMRPSETAEAREELDSTAKRYDIDGGTISDSLEDEELPDWVLEAFRTKSRSWRRDRTGTADLFATHRMFATSLPAHGSVMHKHIVFSPLRTFRPTRRLRASLPKFNTGGRPMWTPSRLRAWCTLRARGAWCTLRPCSST